MQKIVRVVQPDITLFVGESTAGSIIAEQIKELSKAIKIDGIILTKIDCDAKGGSVISIADTTGIPVLLLGSGESYEALSKYSNDFIIDSLLNN
jgi:fused signal recognition particle receptor